MKRGNVDMMKFVVGVVAGGILMGVTQARSYTLVDVGEVICELAHKEGRTVARLQDVEKLARELREFEEERARLIGKRP